MTVDQLISNLIAVRDAVPLAGHRLVAAKLVYMDGSSVRFRPEFIDLDEHKSPCLVLTFDRRRFKP